MNEKIIKKYNIIPSIVVISYIGILLLMLIIALFTPAPRELRDAANVSFALKVAQGQNPYVLSNSHEFIHSINVYSPLNMFIAAFLYVLSGANLYQIFYFLDFIYILMSAVAITYFVKKEYNASNFFVFLTFASSLTLGWRVGFISTIPDHLGMLICIGLLILVHKNKSVLLSSLLTILAFYSKQYFLAIAVVIFLYYLLKSRKKAIQYFISTTVIGVVSLFVMNYFFPSFSVQVLFFMFAENNMMNLDKVYYSIKQMVLAFGTYAFYSLSVAIRTGNIVRNIRKKYDCIDITVFDISNIIMFIVLLYLGTNRGAFLSYHLTLMIPGFIIIGTKELNYFVEEKLKGKRNIFCIWIICLISIALLVKKYEFPIIQTKEEKTSYENAEYLLSKYKGAQYLIPHMGYYTLENNAILEENGHAEYIITLADSQIIRTTIDVKEYAKKFPYLYDLYEYAVDRKEKVIKMIKEQEYSVIARVHEDTMLYGCDITDYYKCIDEIPIVTGTQSYIIDFYIPK